MGGGVVRLRRGDFNAATKYHESPLAVARELVSQGAACLHLIDLDGARRGAPAHAGLICEMAAELPVPVQVGGGIRGAQQARHYLQNGVERIILGTMVMEDRRQFRALVEDYGAQRVLVSLDVDRGRVATRGWQEHSDCGLDEVLQLLRELGVAELIVTDVSRDGSMEGPGLSLTRRVAQAGFRVTAAGGVRNMDDLDALAAAGAAAAIVGRALYEGGMDLAALHPDGLAVRIIPCLDIDNGRVVKGRHFRDLRDVGDPVVMARQYSAAGADELMLLDISATAEGRKAMHPLVAEVAAQLDIPFSVGGGVSVLDDVRALLCAGADKVSIGTAAVENPALVAQAAAEFGSQCIVVSVDALRRGDGWVCTTRGGRRKSSVDALDFCRRAAAQGAGELLINSLDRDGSGAGFDMELLRAVARQVNVPIIASSGAGCADHFLQLFRQTDVRAALAASLFHYGDLAVDELKRSLAANALPVRL